MVGGLGFLFFFLFLNICYAGVNVALAKRLTGCKVLGAGNQSTVISAFHLSHFPSDLCR